MSITTNVKPVHATESAAAGRHPNFTKTCVPTDVPMICPMKTYECRISYFRTHESELSPPR